MQLNKEQQAAVSHTDGPSIILAGAGSGKTRVLIHKVLHLIQKKNVPPYSILMITFTNKAASEMKRRMGAIKLGFIGTFHAFCARVLRIDGGSIGVDQKFVIYDESDQSQLIKSIIKNFPNKYSPSYFLNRISSAKNELITPQRYAELFTDYSSELVAKVYLEYQARLLKNKALDFDDLLLLTHELFKTNKEVLEKYQKRYRHILIDEFQDTNVAQYQIARLLSSAHENITVVGDFSQSIYSWRGADIRNLEKFQKDYPASKVFNLEQNYRSTQQILDYAYSVISHNTTHPILHLKTTTKSGEEIVVYEASEEQDEAFFVIDEIRSQLREDSHSSIGILYRTNAQSRIIEEALLHSGLPYVLIGGTRFYERKEVKDILAYLRFLANPSDEMAIERLKKIGQRRFSKLKLEYVNIHERISEIPTAELMEIVFNTTGYLELYDINDAEDYARIENIKELKSVALRFPGLYDFLEQVTLVESEYSEQEKTKKPLRSNSGQAMEDLSGINLMTLHQAKGLEFDLVIIIGLEEGLLPHTRSIDDLFQLEEERRLFYVGITRARKRLFITFARSRFIFGRRVESIKSRFLLDENKEIS